MGLLDGLVGEATADSKVSVVGEPDERIELLERLNSTYGVMLGNMSTQEQRLILELEDLNGEMEDCASEASKTFRTLSCLEAIASQEGGYLEDFLSNFLMVDEEIGVAITDVVQDLVEPLHGILEPAPDLKFQSVDSRALCKRGWSPGDYAYYLEKLDFAVSRLSDRQIFINKDELVMRDERTLSHIRNNYHLKVLAEIDSLQVERQFLMKIFMEKLRIYRENTQKYAKIIETAYKDCCDILTPMVEFAGRPDSDRSCAPTIRQSAPLGASGLVELAEWQGKLQCSLELASDLANSIVDLGHAEVSLVSPQTHQSEILLREVSVQMSSTLQEMVTERSRAKLACLN